MNGGTFDKHEWRVLLQSLSRTPQHRYLMPVDIEFERIQPLQTLLLHKLLDQFIESEGPCAEGGLGIAEIEGVPGGGGHPSVQGPAR